MPKLQPYVSQVCLLLLEHTNLPLHGPAAQDAEGRTPLEVAGAAFAEELLELHSATRLGASSANVQMPLRSVGRTTLLNGRYHVYQRIGTKVQLAEDVRVHSAVCLKFAPTAEEAEHEANMLRVMGPEFAPELYETFVEQASGQTVLVMQVADSHAELDAFCARKAALYHKAAKYQ